MSVNGLTLGLTKPLCNGLGGGVARRVSSAPTYPSTALAQALIYPDGVVTSGANVTAWNAAVGPNGGPNNTVTSDGTTGVKFAGNLVHTQVDVNASTAFTFAMAFSRTAADKWWFGFTNITDADTYLACAFGDPVYLLCNSVVGAVNLAGATIAATGMTLIRLRRTSAGVVYLAATGVAEFAASSGADLSSRTFHISQMGNNSNATTGHFSRFIYAGTGGDLVESGGWSDLAAWFAYKHGAAL